MVWRMPRSSKVWSSASSAVSSTAPAGMVARLTRRIASCLSCLRVHSVTIASTSSRRSVRAVGSGVARIADQILAAHHLQQAVPVLGVGAAGVDVDVVVRPAALARIDADRRVAAADRLRSGARRRLAVGPLHVGERVADVVQDRVLHRRPADARPGRCAGGGRRRRGSRSPSACRCRCRRSSRRACRAGRPPRR